MLEEGAFGRVGAELDRAVVGGTRGRRLAGAGEEVGAGSVVRLVVLERGGVERSECGETGRGPVELGEATARLSATTAFGRSA